MPDPSVVFTTSLFSFLLLKNANVAESSAATPDDIALGTKHDLKKKEKKRGAALPRCIK